MLETQTTGDTKDTETLQFMFHPGWETTSPIYIFALNLNKNLQNIIQFFCYLFYLCVKSNINWTTTKLRM